MSSEKPTRQVAELHNEHGGLDAPVEPSVDEVTQEQVIRVRAVTADFEQLDQIVELAVDVTTNLQSSEAEIETCTAEHSVEKPRLSESDRLDGYSFEGSLQSCTAGCERMCSRQTRLSR